MAKESELAARVKALEDELRRLTNRPVREILPEERPDYIVHGSDAHAAFLGLRKADAGEKIQQDGWTLQDITAFGVTMDKDILRAILAQKVSQLTNPVPVPQSEDPHAPDYAPPMWRPEAWPISGVS